LSSSSSSSGPERTFAERWSSLTASAKAKLSKVADKLFSKKKNAADGMGVAAGSAATYHSLPSLDDGEDLSRIGGHDDAQHMLGPSDAVGDSDRFTIDNEERYMGADDEFDLNDDALDAAAAAGEDGAIELQDRSKKSKGKKEKSKTSPANAGSSSAMASSAAASSSSQARNELDSAHHRDALDPTPPHADPDAEHASSASHHLIPDL
jgi:hypothetical protein